MGSADRFNSPGSYLKQSAAPGPGSYCAQILNKPSSRYGVLGPELQRMHERLIFEGVGEGADACYNLQSTFDSSKSPSKSSGGFGNSQRFGKFGSHLAGAHSDAPGPGSYSSPSTVTGEITCTKKAGPAPPRAGDRLSFAPSSGMGDSPGPVYEVSSLHCLKQKNPALLFKNCSRALLDRRTVLCVLLSLLSSLSHSR